MDGNRKITKAWARLYRKAALRGKDYNPANLTVLYKDDKTDYFDIFTEQLQFGRDPKTCQYVVGQNDGIDMKFLNKISKIHFVIFKGEEADDTPLLIKDLSRNGTYINGVLIGANQTRIIKTGDVIAVVEPSLKIFDFRDYMEHKTRDLPNEVTNKYFVGRKLGSGAFGVVYKLLDRKQDKYAVKYIKATSMMSQQHDTNIDNEIQIMKKVKHVCIVQTFDVLRDKFRGACLIMEYMAGGDLLTRIINSENKRLTEEQSRFMFFQITEAVKYLHSKGITHRDIKPDNVLLKNDEFFPLVKLTDFGLSKLVSHSTIMTSMIGTEIYTAPEVLKITSDQYTSQIDVWSMGVMLFAMISGTLPFAEEYGNVRSQILSGKYAFIADCWKSVSQNAIRLIRKMLLVPPEIRTNVYGILASSWLNPDHESVEAAIKIMEENGGSVTRVRHRTKVDKEHEFAYPQPPTKRARYDD